MTHIGIDWSMTSPAICIHEGETWAYNNCRFFFRTNLKSMVSLNGLVDCHDAEVYNSQEQRFSNAANWASKKILQYSIPTMTQVTMEGYAMGAKGTVFHIGESTGLLKHFLWKSNYNFHVVPPTVIKKFATGKGNSNKEAMENAFINETGVDPRTLTSQSAKIMTPSADLVDAYYICKYGFQTPVKSMT